MMNALTAVYGLPAGTGFCFQLQQLTPPSPNASAPAGFMIIDVIGVKWSLVLSNILLMSARLLLAFTTKTYVAVFVLYFLMPLGQSLNIPVRSLHPFFYNRKPVLTPLTQVLTIAVRRFTNDDTRSIAYAPCAAAL